MLSDLSAIQWLAICLIFVWSGFVRSGLGFGGAALAMPLMLLVVDAPLLWLPMVATHLLIFSLLTIWDQLQKVDRAYIKQSLKILMIPKIIGVLGLLSLPNDVLVITIYGITLVYGLTYIFNYNFRSGSKSIDYFLLVLGGYASGTTLMGAPLISAVYARHVALHQLRVTLFALWAILVVIKVATFVMFDVDMQLKYSLYMLPMVALGHWLGLKIHHRLIAGNGDSYKKVLGYALVVICSYALIKHL